MTRTTHRRRLIAAFTRLALGINDLSDRIASRRTTQRVAASVERLADTIEGVNRRLDTPARAVRLRLRRS